VLLLVFVFAVVLSTVLVDVVVTVLSAPCAEFDIVDSINTRPMTGAI
jgi:hypothetical protein